MSTKDTRPRSSKDKATAEDILQAIDKMVHQTPAAATPAAPAQPQSPLPPHLQHPQHPSQHPPHQQKDTMRLLASSIAERNTTPTTQERSVLPTLRKLADSTSPSTPPAEASPTVPSPQIKIHPSQKQSDPLPLLELTDMVKADGTIVSLPYIDKSLNPNKQPPPPSSTHAHHILQQAMPEITAEIQRALEKKNPTSEKKMRQLIVRTAQPILEAWAHKNIHKAK